jgi:GNAT superfamily N-acetyltransferase
VRDTLRRILGADAVWSAYAIADLQPEFAADCTWVVGKGPGGDEGLILLYAGLQPPLLFATGSAEAVADALRKADAASALPGAIYLSILPEHEDAVSRWYDVAGSDDLRPMVRMALEGASAGQADGGAGVVRLHGADAPRLERLFAQGGAFAPDAFDAGQIANGVFYAIEQGEGAEGEAPELLAAGGTHIVDWSAGVAAIGNFYTRPAARKQGLAALLLAAIVQDLRAGGVHLIVLNVDRRNAGARRLYERKGFVPHADFLEGTVRRVSTI